MRRIRFTRPAAIALVAVLSGCLTGCGADPVEPADAKEGTPSAGPSDVPSPGGEASDDAARSELESLAASANAAAESLKADPTAPAAQPAGRLFGADVSWPQCPKGMGIPEKRTQGQPMPTDAARFLVIGLTNGPSFVANPCLADQLAWARERHLLVSAYSVLSYPDARTVAALKDKGPYDGSTRLGALRNVGHQAALFNVGSMRDAGLRTPVVWVDVEPVNDFEWSDDLTANAAVVEGTVRGYADAGLEVGFYSTPNLWKRIVGGLRFELPEWRAAGETSMGEALRRCKPDWSFQGGPGVLGQWVEANRDRNVACPGAVSDPAQWFTQY